MAVTKIKASTTPAKAAGKPADKKAPKDTKKAEKALKRAKKAEKRANRKPAPKPIRVITAPFRAIGRYLKNSWIELRQVRWPNRKATWKMVFAVFVYTALLVTIIVLLDVFFTWLFNLMLG